MLHWRNCDVLIWLLTTKSCVSTGRIILRCAILSPFPSRRVMPGHEASAPRLAILACRLSQTYAHNYSFTTPTSEARRPSPPLLNSTNLQHRPTVNKPLGEPGESSRQNVTNVTLLRNHMAHIRWIIGSQGSHGKLGTQTYSHPAYNLQRYR